MICRTAIAIQSKDEESDLENGVTKKEVSKARNFIGTMNSGPWIQANIKTIEIDDDENTEQINLQSLEANNETERRKHLQVLARVRELKLEKQQLAKENQRLANIERERAEKERLIKAEAEKVRLQDEKFIKKEVAKKSDLEATLEHQQLEREHRTQEEQLEREIKQKVKQEKHVSTPTANFEDKFPDRPIPQDLKNDMESSMSPNNEGRFYNPLKTAEAPDTASTMTRYSEWKNIDAKGNYDDFLNFMTRYFNQEIAAKSPGNKIENDSRKPVDATVSTMTANFEFKYPNRFVPPTPKVENTIKFTNFGFNNSNTTDFLKLPPVIPEDGKIVARKSVQIHPVVSTMTENFDRGYVKSPVAGSIVDNTVGTMTENFEGKYPDSPTKKKIVDDTVSTMSENFEWRYVDKPVTGKIIDDTVSTMTANFEWKYPNRPIAIGVQVDDRISTMSENFEWRYVDKPVTGKIIDDTVSTMTQNFEWKYPNRPIAIGVQVDDKISTMSENFEWRYVDKPVAGKIIDDTVSTMTQNFEWRYPDRPVSQSENKGIVNVDHTRNLKQRQSVISNFRVPNFEWNYHDALADRARSSSRKNNRNVPMPLDDKFVDKYPKKTEELLNYTLSALHDRVNIDSKVTLGIQCDLGTHS